MAAWTEELKQKAIDMYAEGDPTPDNSTELVKEIAEELEQTSNGVRQVLVQAGVYVKKGVTETSTPGKDAKADGTKRVSKESQVAALRAEIEKRGAAVDEDVLSKLTGKAATYFVTVLTTK